MIYDHIAIVSDDSIGLIRFLDEDLAVLAKLDDGRVSKN